MENRIKVMVFEPLKEPYIENIKNVPEAYKSIVEGETEEVRLDEKTLLICNSEGKEKELVPNRAIGNDIICGVFYLTGQTKDGDLASIPDSVIPAYMEYFSNNIEKIDPEEVNNCFGCGFEIL